MALYSAAPSCLEGTVVSIVDAKGKVISSGKLNSKGSLTLKIGGSGSDVDCAWESANDIKLTNNGKSILLGVNKKRGGIDKSTPLLFKAKISDYKEGSELLVSHEAAHVVQQKGGVNTKANINTSRSNKKSQRLDTDSDDDGLGDSCDDATISVASKGDGRVEIHVTILK